MSEAIPFVRRRAACWASRASALALVAAALAVPQMAAAQDEGADAAPEQGAIIVTGSRIQRSTFNSPTPMTVIGAETISQLGQVNIGETLATLPQNVSTASDTNVGLTANTSQPNIGASIANLRGLNPRNGVRTMTLVDTRRHVPSTTGGGVDLNLIPSILVQSVETVTGGASAAYGSDAIAGVVNIILDKSLNGIKAQLDYGQTFRGDGSSLHAALAAGTDFAGGRGHVIAGIEYQDNGKVGDCTYAREWCAESPATFQNDGYNTVGSDHFGEAHYVRGDGAAYTNYSLTGVLRGSSAFRFNPPGIRNITFSPDGTQAFDFDPGDYAIGIGFGNRQGGTCSYECSPWSEVQLRPEVERLSTFMRADYEISSSITAILEGSYAFRKSSITGLSLGPSSATPLRADNYYLQNVMYLDRNTGTQVPLVDLISLPANQVGGTSPTTLSQGVDAMGMPVPEVPLYFAKHFRDVPGARSGVDTDLDTYRVMAGLEGELNFLSGWTWDAYYQYGKTSQNIAVSGLRVNEFFTAAIDVVDDPNNPGNPICRGKLDGTNTQAPAPYYNLFNVPYAADCLPLNMIGTQVDPAAVAYAYRTNTEDFNYQQHVAAFNLGGDVFEGWAGPIAVAFGGEYRYEKGAAVHNKLPFGASFSVAAFGDDYGGTVKVLEGYSEVNVPLLANVPLIDYLEVNGAWRYTKQTNRDATLGTSASQSFNTWKISGSWEVTDWLRFRATRSRDVRAPSFIDLYFNAGTVDLGPPGGVVDNPWFTDTNSDPLADFTEVLYPANPGLSPEKGDTLTLGVVLQPSGALDGLRVSVDYYNIKIKNAIGVLTAQQTVDACFSAGVACDKLFTQLGGTGPLYIDNLNTPGLTGGGTEGIQSIARGNANVGRFAQRGYDVEVMYRFPLDKLGDNMPGTLSLRGLATITDKMAVDLGGGGGPVDYLNQTGGSAFGGFTAPSKHILTGYLTYDVGGFSITGDLRYIPTGIYDIRRCDVGAGECDFSDPASINDNTVDSKLYTGLSASYEFGLQGDSTAEVFLSVRNLFDVNPSKANSNASGGLGPVAGGGGPTNPVFYDTLGARWRAGFRLNF